MRAPSGACCSPAPRPRMRPGLRAAAVPHAKSCSGPRNPSGLSPENSCAWLPLLHVSRPIPGSHFKLLLLRFATLRSPLTPSTMIRRASSMLAPTRAIRTSGRLRASFSIHSAPALVLPKPRPAIISQVRQPPSVGSIWLSWHQFSKSASCSRTSCQLIARMIRAFSSGFALASLIVSSRRVGPLTRRRLACSPRAAGAARACGQAFP